MYDMDGQRSLDKLEGTDFTNGIFLFFNFRGSKFFVLL